MIASKTRKTSVFIFILLKAESSMSLSNHNKMYINTTGLLVLKPSADIIKHECSKLEHYVFKNHIKGIDLMYRPNVNDLKLMSDLN